MLSELDIGRFRAFGYVFLRSCLSRREVARLREAHDRVMAAAPINNYFGGGAGTRTLAPFVEADDAFGELIEHPGVMEAMRDIWGTECLYNAGSDMWSNLDDTPWHSDGDPGREGLTLKTAFYLDEQDENQGALNVIPGSHHPEFCAAVFRGCGYWDERRPRLRLDPHDIPGAVSLQTIPGDVVLWDNRLWHSAFRRSDGRPRRTMFIGYTPDPLDDLLEISALRATVGAHLQGDYPLVYSRAMMRKGGQAREKMAARLESLGVDNVRE